MRRALSGLALAAMLAILGAPAAASPSLDLDRARSSFRAKDWQSARLILKDLLYPQPRLASVSDLVESHVLLGVCYYETGQREEARTEFEAALSLEPAKTLEPPYYTNGQIRVFDDVRGELTARAERDAELRKLADERERIRKWRESRYVYEIRPYYVNFIPFGAGQFQNKQRGKGVLFAAGQALTGGASAGIFLYLATRYGLVAKVPLEDGERVRRLQQLEIGTGIAFIGLYAWGVVDSLLNHKPRAQVEADDSLLPPELQPPPRPRTKTSLRDRLRWGPVLLPGGAGFGLSLEND